MIQVMNADEGLLLALLNTTPMIAGARADLLGDAEKAHAWLEEHASKAHLDEDLELLRSTRDSLQALVRGETEPTALTPALDGVRYRAVIDDTGITWELATPAGHAVVARAVVAWGALRHSAPGRLRSCENTDECRLFLIDHSKSNSARWCSMAGCGNRMKARRHYERRRNARHAR